jgi:enoyl-CoA hydratase/carnithine racemase
MGPVTIVTIDRPEVRNAVDRPTATLLADAFRAFDADDSERGRDPHRRRRHVLRRVLI